MKPGAFDYIRAETQPEALDALAEAGDEAAVLAGGLSLVAMMNMRLARPEVLVDINGLDELGGVMLAGSVLRTGALLRQAEALASGEVAETVPLLARALPNVGHYQTRSRGTLAGSVAHADPSAETPLCLATLDGAVELTSTRGTRQVPARDFAEAALVTRRESDEMISALLWPVRRGGAAFAEVNQRHGDFAIVAAAAWAQRDGSGRGFRYALGLGGVEDRPRVHDGEAVVEPLQVEELARGAAADFAALLQPMQDPRADAAYRRHLAGHLGREVLATALRGAMA